MKLCTFKEHNGVIAEFQPPYYAMPVYTYRDTQDRIACCWKLTFIERLKVLFTGKIWHQILRFKQDLQPQKLTVDKPAMPSEVS